MKINELLKKYWRIIIVIIIIIYLIIPKSCGQYYPERSGVNKWKSDCIGLRFGSLQILENPTYDTSIPAYCIGICP